MNNQNPITFQQAALLPPYTPVIVIKRIEQRVETEKGLLRCLGNALLIDYEIDKNGVHSKHILASTWEKQPGLFFNSWQDSFQIFLDENPLPDNHYSYPSSRKIRLVT